MNAEGTTIQHSAAKEKTGRIGSGHPGLIAWIRLARLYTAVDLETNRFLRQFDLTTAQFDLIAQVGAHEGLTQQELAEALLVTKGNVTQLLDRLERRGLIERRVTPGVRGKAIHLTEEGWRLNRKVVPEQERRMIETFSSLEPDEQRQLGRMLRTVTQSLGEPGSGA